ncbi:MAG TPA: type I methionyl aminopeptidase [Dermatophilaceae bacterium]|nr:type I methionyl aminopeptidase [Dermatophilaceae bacterium]
MIFGRKDTSGWTKTPDQLVRMRAAGLVVGRTLGVLADRLRAGLTTADLDDLARTTILDQGGRPSFPEVPGYRHTLCVSVNDEVVHGVPGARVIQDGDLVSVDCGAIVDGWHGDAAISVVCGGPDAGSSEDLALIDATEASLWDGIAALAVGQPLYAVGAAIEDSIVAAGQRRDRPFGIVEEYVGHGIGQQMHEEPQVPNYRVRDRGPIVRPGLAVAVEPMMTLGSPKTKVLDDEWTVVTRDGSRAAHWEHTVAVTDGGLWVLTALDGGERQLSARGAAYAPLA